MPLKTNVGVSRKVSDNSYGSHGASVNLEVELESALINEPERFHDRIRQVFRLAQQSIDEELTRQQAGAPATANGHAAAHNGNGPANGRAASNGNGNGGAKPNGRKATASQVRALHAIAAQWRLRSRRRRCRRASASGGPRTCRSPRLRRRLIR